MAKVTPPRLRNVLVRERLFRLLDSLRDRALIWVSAPAGSGKSTLVASWIKTLAATQVWFQCDEGDGDIAAFFHFLTVAVSSGGVEPALPLPRLTPELYSSLSVFVRNYFRQLFARLKRPAVLVLDNWQDVPAAAHLRDLLPLIVEEVPHDVLLIVVSRDQPGTNLSRCLNTDRMSLLSWSDLQLSEAETAGIAALYEPMPEQHAIPPVEDIHALAHGWAAGVVALLRHESLGRPPQWSEGESNGSNQVVFDYFASEVFDRQEAAVQDFMIKTALLESISVTVARQLTGNENAKQILDRFVNRNVFTVHRPASGSYHYHPLFRSFLESRAQAIFSPLEQQQHLQRAATILAAQDNREAAIHLLLTAQLWNDAATLIADVAPLLSQQGRFKTLTDWIEALPAAERERSPWLCYWLGVCRMAVGHSTARVTLEAAYALFASHGDTLGRMMAAADIIQHDQMGFSDFAPSDPWIDILCELLESQPRFPSKEIELRIYAGVIGTLAFVAPSSRYLRAYTEHTRELTHQVIDVDCKAYAVASLLTQQVWSGDTHQFRSLISIADSLLAQQDLAPIIEAQIHWASAYFWFLLGDFDKCHTLLHRAYDITMLFGISQFSQRVPLSRLQATDFIQHHQAIGAELQRIAPAMAATPPGLQAHVSYVKAVFYFSARDYERGLSCARETYAFSGRVHYRFGQLLAALLQGEIYCELGELDSATEQLASARRILHGADSPMYEHYIALLAAEIARHQSNMDDCLAQLRRAFAIGRLHQYACLHHGYPLLFMRLVPIALENGIDVEHCHYLIKKRSLKPPSFEIENWPWPVKIHTLGKFVVQVDGEVLEPGVKSQHKPLELLKALLAHSSGIAGLALMDRLWPDLDGDSARNALDLALHRLRRLIQRKDAVVVADGTLSIDRNRVWVDAWALEALCDRDAPPTELHRITACMQSLLQLYRGPFLANDNSHWAFTMRDRLHSKFTRRVMDLAKAMQDLGLWDELATLYAKGIELDPLNEEFHRGLVHSYRSRGLDAEASAAYRRCTELWSQLSGSEPTAAIRAAIRHLG